MILPILRGATFFAIFSFCLPAADPRLSEFLGVKAWEGTVTVKAAAEGNMSGASGSDHWNLSWDANFQVTLKEYVAFGRFWQGTITSGNVTVRHKDVFTGGSGCVLTFLSEGAGFPVTAGSPNPIFFLYAGPGEVYTFYAPGISVTGKNTGINACPDETATQVGPEVPLSWWPQNLDSHYSGFPFPATGFNLSGTASFPLQFPLVAFSFFGSGQTTPTTPAVVTWSFRPLGVTETEVVVESPALDTWRPLGTLEGKRGNTIDLTAKLVEKGTENPPQGARVVAWTWDFTTVSREPGVLMNYPRRADAGTKPDLRFEENPNFQLDAEGQHATALPRPTLGTTSTITVGSYDWGSFGTVKVTCELEGGKKYVGYLKTDPAQTEIRLPKRNAGSFIAEVWKRDKGVMGKADSADDEKDPIGDGTPGDGLTLYQEYRGFVENGQRVEGDPLKKDYFINTRTGDGFLQGILLFRRLSGLKVHYRIGDDEMEDDRVINRNYEAGPRVTDQHAVWVRTNDGIAGFAIAEGGPGTPRMIKVIYMPLKTPVTYEAALLGESQVNYRNTALAHELMHACNVYHHGDSGDYDATWVRGVGTDNVSESGQPIDVLLESGENVNNMQPLQREVHVGASQGHCSGEVSCIMRYEVCAAYVPRSAPGIRYRANEQWGNNLCLTGQGTDTNAEGRTPQSRYGPAASGRGACALQILVNDAVSAPRR